MTREERSDSPRSGNHRAHRWKFVHSLVLWTLVAALLNCVPAGTHAPGSPAGHVSVGGAASEWSWRAMGPGPAQAVAWPTYLFDSERTGANLAERTIAPSNVSQLRETLSLPSNGSDFSAPIVVNNIVYYGSWNGYEHAVNLSTRNVVWSLFLGTDPGCGGYSPMGISSTPAYVNGTLYLGGGDGYWYALNATTGAVEWRFFVGALPTLNNYDWASALVYRKSLYIGVASCFDNPLIRGALIEVNLTGSHTANHTFYSVPAGQTGANIWTTPAVDPRNNTIWVSTGNENTGYPIYANAIVALNATTLAVRGSWQVPSLQGLDSDFGSTPTLFHSASGTALVVATNKNGVAYAFNRSNVSAAGSWGPIWTLNTGGGFSSGAFDGQTLYLAGNGLYAVNPSNGTVLWQNSTVTGVYSALTWANGIVYVGGGTSIDAFDAQTGRRLWNATVPGGGTIVAEPVVTDGWLFVPSGNYATEGNFAAYSLSFGAVASASPTSGIANLAVGFVGQAVGGLTPYHVEWMFGDGTVGAGPSVVHVYTAGGTFAAWVAMNDSAGGSIAQAFSIHVVPAVVASVSVAYLNVSSACPGTPTTNTGPLQVRLTANASGGVPPVTDRWSFSSGGTAVGPVVVRNLTQAFTARLTATDSVGHSVNVSQAVAPPVFALPSCSARAAGPGVWYLIAGIIAGITAVGLLVAVLGLTFWTRRRRPERTLPQNAPPKGTTPEPKGPNGSARR